VVIIIIASLMRVPDDDDDNYCSKKNHPLINDTRSFFCKKLLRRTLITNGSCISLAICCRLGLSKVSIFPLRDETHVKLTSRVTADRTWAFFV